MKTIIQLLIVALIINACFQAGRAYYGYYDFKDAIELEVRRGHQSTTSQLHQKLLEMAQERGLKLEYEDISVTRKGDDTAVDFRYDDEIPFVPRFYTRPWVFEGEVIARRMTPLTYDEAAR